MDQGGLQDRATVREFEEALQDKDFARATRIATSNPDLFAPVDLARLAQVIRGVMEVRDGDEAGDGYIHT